jgi:peroxiredoxin
MVEIGKGVADGTYQAYHRDKIVQVKVSDHRGKWFILFFYPGDFTFVCPTELGELAELYPQFQKAGAEVWGVSTDSVYVHKAWHDASPTIKAVPYPLVADPTGTLSREFGAYVETAGVALRGSFILDPDGVLRAYELHDLPIGRSAHELLRKLQAAIQVREGQGEVCPASWKPGQKTLKPGLELVGKL